MTWPSGVSPGLSESESDGESLSLSRVGEFCCVGRVDGANALLGESLAIISSKILLIVGKGEKGEDGRGGQRLSKKILTRFPLIGSKPLWAQFQ